MKPSKILKEYIEKRVKEAYGKEIGFDLDNFSAIKLGEMYGTAKMCLQSKQKLDQMIQEHELDLV